MNIAIESQLHAALKPRPKKIRLLDALVAGPKTSFELGRAPTRDHCANSTVSEWRKQGIEILTEMVTVSGYQGEQARIAKYTLAESSRQRALQLIGKAQ
jgi:hypothetical protein